MLIVTDEIVELACRKFYDRSLQPGQYRWEVLVLRKDRRVDKVRADMQAALEAVQDHITSTSVLKLVDEAERILLALSQDSLPKGDYPALARAIERLK